MRSLSRLKALQAFEATARHGSFVGAGTELNVTPAAVGQMVRSLETWLGSPLFKRRATGFDRLVVLEDARDALGKLQIGLDALDDGMRQLKMLKNNQAVTATASQAIVAKWLLPNLHEFSARHPNVVVRLDVTDRIVDLLKGEADIGIRCGPGTWKGLESTHLHDEEIIVVCAPTLIPESGTVDLSWLSAQTLLHDTTPAAINAFPDWQYWAETVGSTGIRFDQGVRINASTAIIQAAITGQGVALARRALVSQDIADGRLVRIFADIRLPIDWGYFAVASPQALTRAPVAAFRDWLVSTWQ